jgi:hypothetical protein
VVLPISEVRRIVERVCARQDVYDACAKRDLGYVIGVLNANHLTQEQIASLTGLHQNRLSNYKTGKHEPKEISVFASFADGLGLPASGPAGTGTRHRAADRSRPRRPAASPRLCCRD